MDLEIQQRVKDLTEKHGAENVIVVIGGAEAEGQGVPADAQRRRHQNEQGKGTGR